MGKRAFLLSGALLSALGLTLAPSWSQQNQTAPAKAVEVTYYYLPG